MLNAMRNAIVRMLAEDKKKKKRKVVKKPTPAKKSIGWIFDPKTGRYEPTLATTKRRNF
jgi:hypothetical protein